MTVGALCIGDYAANVRRKSITCENGLCDNPGSSKAWALSPTQLSPCLPATLVACIALKVTGSFPDGPPSTPIHFKVCMCEDFTQLYNSDWMRTSSLDPWEKLPSGHF